MIVDVLLGLLCCKTNDVMNKFMLPTIVYAKEGKEEERLWWLVACGWSSGKGGSFIRGGILWIALEKSKIMKRTNMLGFYRKGCFVDCKEGRWRWYLWQVDWGSKWAHREFFGLGGHWRLGRWMGGDGTKRGKLLVAGY